jgi:hypothetical protein
LLSGLRVSGEANKEERERDDKAISERLH